MSAVFRAIVVKPIDERTTRYDIKNCILSLDIWFDERDCDEYPISYEDAMWWIGITDPVMLRRFATKIIDEKHVLVKPDGQYMTYKYFKEKFCRFISSRFRRSLDIRFHELEDKRIMNIRTTAILTAVLRINNAIRNAQTELCEIQTSLRDELAEQVRLIKQGCRNLPPKPNMYPPQINIIKRRIADLYIELQRAKCGFGIIREN